MLVRLILLSFAIYMMALSAVHAAPVAVVIASAAAATWGGAILGGAVATIGALSPLMSFGIRAGLGLALQGLQARQQRKRAAGANEFARGYDVTTVSPLADHQIIYGRSKVHGVSIFAESTNDDKYLHRIIAYAAHSVEQFSEIYLGEDKLTLDSNGFVTSPSRYAGLVRIKIYKGSGGQTADPDLVAESEAGWSTRHRLQGIAYLYARYESNPDAFPDGEPELWAVIKGKPVYDPRTGLTVWSENPALCLRDYITSDFGLAQSADEVNDTFVAAAANICDESVTLAGFGTEKRYTCNGAFTTGESRDVVLDTITQSMAGVRWWQQGEWYMRAGAWVPAVHSFDENDLRSSIKVNTRHSRRHAYNSVIGEFRGEESSWQYTDYPSVESDEFLAADGGLSNPLDLPLNMTNSSSMAQRIAKIALYRNREQLTIKTTLGARGLLLAPGSTIMFSKESFGWVDKTFEVQHLKIRISPETENEGPELLVDVTLREISGAVFDWNAEEKAFETNNTNLPSVTAVDIPAISISTELRLLNETAVGVMIIEATAGSNRTLEFEIEYKKSSDTEWISLGRQFRSLAEAIGVEDDYYDVRARSINFFGVRSSYQTISNYQVSVFAPPPEDVEEFAVNVVGGAAHLSWKPVSDLDLSHYRIRFTESDNPSYSDAIDLVSKVPRPANTVTVPAKSGTYYIKAFDKLGNPSESPASFTLDLDTSDIEQMDLAHEEIENPSFGGTTTRCVVTGDDISTYIALDSANLFDSETGLFDDAEGLFDSGSGVTLDEGIYEFEDYVDLGSIFISRVEMSLDVERLDYSLLFDSVPGSFDDRSGLFDGDPDAFDDINVVLQISTTTDDPASSPTWTDWKDFIVGDFRARAFRFRILLRTTDSRATPIVRALKALINMPDRVESEEGLTFTGTTDIVYGNAFNSVPALGLNVGYGAGERYEVTSSDRNGFTITVYDGASPSTNQSTLGYVARGYGKEIS